MARSSYIYVVLADDQPVAAFTVKHEMKTWLGRFVRVPLRVVRLKDNPLPGQAGMTEVSV